MRICYLTHMRLPTEKAYGLQMVNTMYHLSLEGVEMHLIDTFHQNPLSQGLFEYYGIPKVSIHRHTVWSSTLFQYTRFGFWLNMLTFSIAAGLRILKLKADIVYSREPFPLIFFGLLGKKTLYEMHDFPKNHHWFHAFLCRSVSHIAVTNAWASDRCIKEYAIAPQKIIIVPNGFDEKKFDGSLSREDSRTALSLPLDRKIVLYSGHLYTWKGTEVIYAVARRLPDVLFVFVGGTVSDQKKLLAGDELENVCVVAHQPPDSIPTYLAAADVLVLPNIPINQHSEYSTSPIKLFEYLASRRPVIASRLPAITSVVGEDQVIFAEAGNIDEWSDTIRFVLADTGRFQVMVDTASVYAQQYSWKSKAQRLVAHMS